MSYSLSALMPFKKFKKKISSINSDLRHLIKGEIAFVSVPLTNTLSTWIGIYIIASKENRKKTGESVYDLVKSIDV